VVRGVKLDKLATNVPVVPDTITFEFDVVGPLDVLYTIPRSVIVAPPSPVIFPPDVAVLGVMAETAVVVNPVGAVNANTVNVAT
jgi:hypothetical protein